MNVKIKIMKKLKKHITLLFFVCIAFSCSEETLVDEVTEGTTRGLVLRQVGVLGENYDIADTSSLWGVTVEVQDEEGGSLLSEVQVYVTFVETTVPEGEDDIVGDEELVATIPASNFSPGGDFGLPRGDISVTYAEAIAAAGITQADIEGGDVFNFRFEAVLTDGRTFTNDANGTVTGGTFFRSPFAYASPVVCPPTPPTPGTWTIDMQDSYGDGWNGASLSVTLDGTTTDYLIEDGAALSVDFEVESGTEVISIVYNSGAWDSEVTFQVTSANGSVILDLGPEPTAGSELLDYCLGDIL